MSSVRLPNERNLIVRADDRAVVGTARVYVVRAPITRTIRSRSDRTEGRRTTEIVFKEATDVSERTNENIS